MSIIASALFLANIGKSIQLPVVAAKDLEKSSGQESEFFSVFTTTDMPVWLSLLLALLAGLGTYYLAPRITRRLEIGKAKSEHVIGSIKEINRLIVLINKSIRGFIFSFRLDASSTEEKRSEILDGIAEIQWRIVDLKVILSKRNDSLILEELGNKIETLRKEAVSMNSDSNQNDMLNAVGEVSESLKIVLDRLYSEARLK